MMILGNVIAGGRPALLVEEVAMMVLVEVDRLVVVVVRPVVAVVRPVEEVGQMTRTS